MWVLSMKDFYDKAEKLEDAASGIDRDKRDRVIRLLLGDKEFMSRQTLESIADIINHDAQEVFEEYGRQNVTSGVFEKLCGAYHMARRRIL